MRELLVIGIGAGDPDQVTVQAIKAMNRAGAFFVIDKGTDKQELAALRTTLLDEHVRGPYRVIEIADPPRERTPGDYEGTVDDWHDRRAALFAEAFSQVDGVGAILVWGDPALYDSTLRIVERVLTRADQDFTYSVIPGVTSVHALAAAHRILLNRVGEPIHITTGRRLREEGMAPGRDNVVVMLDSGGAFTEIPGDDIDIYWGAYLGTADETLVAGPLREVEQEIVRVRADLRARKGWIMDTYLLRRRAAADAQE